MEQGDKNGNVQVVGQRMTVRYHAELTRFSTWLFGSMMVTMTFLLLAGLRNPRIWLVIFMYVAVASFALVVLIHPLLQLWSSQLLVATAKEDGAVAAKTTKKAKAAAEASAASPSAGLAKRLKVARIAQQVIFVIGVLATLGFAIEVSSYLFVTAAAPAAGASGQAGA